MKTYINLKRFWWTGGIWRICCSKMKTTSNFSWSQRLSVSTIKEVIMINPTKEAKNNKFLVTKIHFVNRGEYGFQGSTDESRSALDQVVRSGESEKHVIEVTSIMLERKLTWLSEWFAHREYKSHDNILIAWKEEYSSRHVCGYNYW